MSAGTIVLAAAAVIGGISFRDRTDLHLSSFNLITPGRSLVASNSSDAPDVSAADFFEQISDLLKRDYVDPISDDNKLTAGAIRGMVNSLENPDCLFMDATQFKVFTNARAGKYEGIGVDLALEIPAKAAKTAPGATAPLSSDAPIGTRIPALVVAAVVPGGPADKAGVKPGDSVESVDNHWVLNPYALQALKDLQGQYDAEKDAGKKQALMDKLIEVRKDLRKKLESSLMPLKARDRLVQGTSGSVRVVWNREGALKATNIAKAPSSEVAASKDPDGSIALHFMPGASSKLKELLPQGPVVLDLRNNAFGDFDEMRRCLAELAPAGNYGQIDNLKDKPAHKVSIENGSSPRQVTIIADNSTRGVAEMFALALQEKGLAKVNGEMSDNRNLIETVPLPDGSGYTLVVGKYSATPAQGSGA